MEISLKQYENFLKKKRKTNGDILLPSTIEKYCDWINKYLISLNACADNKAIIEYMNVNIQKANSNVVTAAFTNFAQLKGFSQSELAEIKHCKVAASALTSHRFLQSKVLSRGELKRLMHEMDNIFDKAIVCSLYDTACRRSELMSIKFGDINFKNPKNISHKKDIDSGICAEIQIMGKGKKARTVYLGATSAKLVVMLHEKFGYQKTDKVFLLKQDDGMPYIYQTHELYKKIIGIGKVVLGRHIHPHCFRHTKATHMADTGADMLDIAAYLGHSNPSTSAIYIEISAFRGKQAFAKFTKDIMGEV